MDGNSIIHAVDVSFGTQRQRSVKLIDSGQVN